MARAQSPISIGLQSEVKSFLALLSGDAAFDVPYLQRGFEWAEAEVSAMAGDLYSASEGGYRSYFLGHIVGVKNASGAVDLVDGQQRIVSTTILFAFLRDQLAPYAPELADELQSCIVGPKRMRVRPRAADAAFLADWMQTPGKFDAFCALGDASGNAAIQSDAQALMVQAARTIRAQFDKPGHEALERFANFILDRAVIDFIVADDRTMAAILYRGMNMRGKQLSPADLIKLEAIESAGLDEEAKQTVATAWEAAEDKLRSDNFSFLLEILPLIVSRNTTMRPGDLAEWRKNVFQSGNAREVLETLLPIYADVFEEILNGEIQIDAQSPEDKIARMEINGLVRGLLFLQEDRQWIAPAIAAISAHRGRPTFLAKFMRGLDRLTFACFLDGVRTNERNHRFAEVIRAGADTARLEHAFSLRRHEVDEVAKRLRQQFRRDSWRRLAIAARINAALHMGAAFKPGEDFTVEHVAPKSQCPAWQAVGWGKDEVARSANLIGNLVLVPKTVNALANRHPLPRKLEQYFKDDIPLLPLTEDIRGAVSWPEQVVRERTERLTTVLLRDWDLA